MNCKEGDLAVVVNDVFGAAGTIVTCLRLASSRDFYEHNCRNTGAPAWFVDVNVKASVSSIPIVHDSSLRPIRDNPGADETLSWKDVPQEVSA